MLQRAASNAYSWWVASHIRTKQSKWLDNNVQDMEDKVKAMVKLIDADGDSFAKKAELYFRRRPELIAFVEETFKAYKALADKFDRVSTELHRANHALATAFPDQIHLTMQDDDDEETVPTTVTVDPSRIRKLDLKKDNNKPTEAPKRQYQKRLSPQISQEKAQEEIERLQKEILVMQTEKEFVKSSYQSGLAKYWNIEKQITEMQEDVSNLQEDFDATAVIEDNEARTLMATSAIKSCEDSLMNLQKQQMATLEEAKAESEKMKQARAKLNAIRTECGQPVNDSGNDKGTEEFSGPEEVNLDLQSICAKVKEHFEGSSEESAIEMAEKIDGLVDQVIALESTVSSQAAQLSRLRAEAEEVQKHLESLEEEKKTLGGDSGALLEKLNAVENELQKVQQLEKSMKDEKNEVNVHMTEVCNSFYGLSGDEMPQVTKAQSEKKEEQIEVKDVEKIEEKVEEKNVEKDEEKNVINVETYEENTTVEKNEDKSEEKNVERNEDKTEENKKKPVSKFDLNSFSRKLERLRSNLPEKPAPVPVPEEDDDEPEYMEDGEYMDDAEEPPFDDQEQEEREQKLLLKYTSILRNYKDTKHRTSEIEQKNQEHYFQTMAEVVELKNSNAMKDEEIRLLRDLLSSLQSTLNQTPVNANANSPTDSEDFEDQPDKDTPVSPQPERLSAEDNIRLRTIIVPDTSSAIEEKFRAVIDGVLEENLDFWLRFSTSYHQIQTFQLIFKELHAELQAEFEKASSTKPLEGADTEGAAPSDALKLRMLPHERKLRELNTELQVWLEHNALLKGELQCRFSSLCSIQDEISNMTSDDNQFMPYLAAKFQGEVLNMQLENNKVAKELQAGVDHVRALQIEVGRALSRIRDTGAGRSIQQIQARVSQQNQNNSSIVKHTNNNNNNVPLKTFLFGAKQKKKKSVFGMNPHLPKHYNDIRHK